MIDKNSMIVCHKVEDGSKIKAEWDKIFATSVDEITKSKIYFHQFKWNLFSNNVLEALEGDVARKCFNMSLKEKIYESYRDSDKNKLYAFYQDEYEAYEIEISEQLEANNFNNECDLYIFDLENKWTYINRVGSETLK